MRPVQGALAVLAAEARLLAGSEPRTSLVFYRRAALQAQATVSSADK